MSRTASGLIVLLFLAGCAASSSSGPRWYKGNIHTHTLWSDGDEFPEVVAEWYRDHGYHFLALSDHNVLSDGQRWLDQPTIVQRKAQLAVKRYLARRSWPADSRGTPGESSFAVRLRTYGEIRQRMEKPEQFLLIQAEEISDSFQKIPIHIGAVNVGELIKPQGGTSVTDVMTRNLRAVQEQGRRLNRPVLPHVNHPNFHYAISAEQLAEVLDENFFEVYNGHPGVAHRGDEEHPGVERIWDLANTLRIVHYQAPPLFGLAVDDSHNYSGKPGMSRASPGRGWIMVRAAELTPAALFAAMRAGDFYASSGVVLRDVNFRDKRLTVQVERDGSATFTTRFIGTRKGATSPSEIGTVLAEVTGRTASYTLRGDELYVRAVVTSSKPAQVPVYANQKKQAWTQPVRP